ncbi:hypothetical protein ACIQ4I_11225 [Rummeliibacillus sp. NPDC094406]|uniref:hypothetical protein n=1 Tax=Rummeliibacillus sp. NPDC094406 TaxID=3364511 RepID=UPI003802488D
MNDTKKAKWLIGSSAVLLSAGLLTQLNVKGTTEDNTTSNNQQVIIDQSKVSKKEKELLQLDWTNFEITKVPTVKQDRQTRRS